MQISLTGPYWNSYRRCRTRLHKVGVKIPYRIRRVETEGLPSEGQLPSSFAPNSESLTPPHNPPRRRRTANMNPALCVPQRARPLADRHGASCSCRPAQPPVRLRSCSLSSPHSPPLRFLPARCPSVGSLSSVCMDYSYAAVFYQASFHLLRKECSID